MSSKSYQLAELGDKIILNELTMAQLKLIDCPIVPICAIGPTLVGKSSLLNDIIGSSVFKVSQTTNSVTKGIWVYPHYIAYGNQQGSQTKKSVSKVCLLFIDVQGFDQLRMNNDIDLAVMAMMTLVCHFIFWVNRGALQSSIFGRISQVLEKIPSKLKNNPNLLLVQTDFNLKLLDCLGDPITADDYLETCMSSLKDRNISQTVKKYFLNKNSNNFKNKKLKVYLLANKIQQTKYNRTISEIIEKISSINCHENKTMAIVDFVFRLEQSSKHINQFIQKNQQGWVLKNFQQKVDLQKLEEFNILKSDYRNHAIKQSEKIAKNQLPLPAQLLNFKLHQVQESFFAKTQFRNYQVSVLGKQTINNINEKTRGKLIEQNHEKISQFLEQQLEISAKQISHEYSETELLAFISQCKYRLYSQYSFLNQKQQNLLIERQLWKKIALKLKNQVASFEQQGKKTEIKTHQLVQKNQNTHRQFEKLTNQYKSKIMQLQTTISKLKKDNKSLQNQLQEKMNNQSDYNQIKSTIQDYQQCLNKNYQKQNQFFKDFREFFIETITDQKCQISNLSKNKNYAKQYSNKQQQWIEKLDRIQKHLSSNQKAYIDELTSNKQRITNLQNSNKMLRQRLSDLHLNSTSSLVEEKYKQLQIECKNLQNKVICIAKEKQQSLNDLTKKLQKSEELRLRTNEEIGILRMSLKDKGKGTQFMQKILQEKQQMLDSLRKQLINNIEKTRKQISAIQNQSNTQIYDLSSTIAHLTLKADRAISENSFLREKIENVQSRTQEKYNKQRIQKEQQLQKLRNELNYLQISVDSTTEAYKEVTEKLENVIKSRESQIAHMNNRLLTITHQRDIINRQYDEMKVKYSETKQQFEQSKMQYQRLENDFKRSEVLFENKCKHLSMINEKLKFEIKDKNSTFQVMLRQLRGQNILQYGLKPNYKEDLQERILKEIHDLNNQQRLCSAPQLKVQKQKNARNQFQTHKKARSENRNKIQTILQSHQENINPSSSPLKPQNLQHAFEKSESIQQRFSIKNRQSRLSSKKKEPVKLNCLDQFSPLQVFGKIKNSDLIPYQGMEKHNSSLHSISTVGFKTIARK